MTATTHLRVTCPDCGPLVINQRVNGTLVKAAGEPVIVLYTCPKCSTDRRQVVSTPLVNDVCELFRVSGKPLVSLPPQGDLPWPPLSYDDLLEFGLHSEEIIEHLLDSDG